MSISVILTSNPRPPIWQKLGQMGAPVEGRGTRRIDLLTSGFLLYRATQVGEKMGRKWSQDVHTAPSSVEILTGNVAKGTEVLITKINNKKGGHYRPWLKEIRSTNHG